MTSTATEDRRSQAQDGQEERAQRALVHMSVKRCLVSSSPVSVLQFALDGVSQQQQAIAGNLANAQTPGYTAEHVSFEQSLERAISEGGTASITEQPSAAPPATDGNNVDLTTELVAAQQSTLQYQVITNALNDQFHLVQGAAGGPFT